MKQENQINTRILPLLIDLTNKGFSPTSVKTYNAMLIILSKRADLDNPETVNKAIASLQTSSTYKKNLTKAYAHYARYYELEWNKPKYLNDTKTIRVPTKERLEMLIARGGRILSTKLQISYQTGMRPVEVCNLRVKDIDFEKHLIYPAVFKHGQPRVLKFNEKLEATLRKHIQTYKLDPNDKLFKGNETRYGNNYREMRNELAKKLNDPALATVRLYDFRHYFATMLYEKTKDILYVKQQMGHKKLDSTMVYTHLLNVNEEEYTVRTAQNIKEATDLLEHGFQYVTEMDGLKLFKKRK